jgi:alginate O-acetyltransferase complex protein AlgJ
MSQRNDPLTLPPVPPPAPATHPLRDFLLAFVFVVGLVLTGLAALQPPAQPALEFENRMVTPWPPLTWTNAFTTSFERAFGDRFGARNTLLRAHHLALLYGFDVSPATNVLLGRDDWLYFLGEDGRSLDRYYRGTLPISDAEIAAVVTELRRRQQFLAALGIAYVVTIVPEKYTIYPEHLPSWVIKADTPTPLERLTAAISADGRVRFVDLRAPLVTAKLSKRVYYTTDSHWNLQGAAVAYGEIMQEIERALPSSRLSMIAPAVLPPYVAGVDVYSGDLARFVGLPPRYREPDLASLSKVLADPSARCGKRIDGGTDEGFEIYACNRLGLPRAVMYRDSMAIPLIPLLSENFSRIVYVSARRLDPALILREKPDVVIEEMVERSLHAPAALPMEEVR